VTPTSTRIVQFLTINLLNSNLWFVARGEGVEGGSAVEAVVAAHLSTVCDIVNKFQEECAVVEVGLACVKNICTKGTNFAPTNDSALLAAANLIPTMMMKYGDQQEATLMEQGCLAAQAVVKSDYLANALLDGGIRAALDAASDSIENERNKSYPEKTLKAIEVVLAGE
jgi:hypothetical protein